MDILFYLSQNCNWEVIVMFQGIIFDKYDSFGHRIVYTIKGKERFILTIRELVDLLDL